MPRGNARRFAEAPHSRTAARLQHPPAPAALRSRERSPPSAPQHLAQIRRGGGRPQTRRRPEVSRLRPRTVPSRSVHPPCGPPPGSGGIAAGPGPRRCGRKPQPRRRPQGAVPAVRNRRLPVPASAPEHPRAPAERPLARGPAAGRENPGPGGDPRPIRGSGLPPRPIHLSRNTLGGPGVENPRAAAGSGGALQFGGLGPRPVPI